MTKGGELASVRPASDFDEWVAPHLATMRRYAFVVDPARDPDDVVQDALERAWLRWDTYRAERGSPRTWLLAIVADRARRARTRARTVELALLDTSATDVSAARWPERIAVRDAVRRLPRRQREATVLHYYVGLTVPEVAVLMRCADGTVKSTLSDARAALARMLGDDT